MTLTTIVLTMSGPEFQNDFFVHAIAGFIVMKDWLHLTFMCALNRKILLF